MGTGKRKAQPRIDKMFLYLDQGRNNRESLYSQALDSDDSEFKGNHSKKRTKKARSKTAKNKAFNQNSDIKVLSQDDVEIERRKVPNGVSVFDLIMPWKLEVKNQENTSQLQKDNLAKVVTTQGKQKVLDINLE